jgi:hypothetical protein
MSLYIKNSMHLRKFFTSKNGRQIMSAILGFGLASMFRVACKDKSCIRFMAPPVDMVEGGVYKSGDKCYKYSHKSIKCNKNVKSVRG